MIKSIEEHFTDWHSHAFGFGYGSGEPHIIPALKTFFEACLGDTEQYDYEFLEKVLGPTVTWLIINALCRHGVDVIDYGTSPRFGWMTKQGSELKAFFDSKSVDELLELTYRDQNYVHCYPDTCNCGPSGYQKGVKCDNPFWK